MVNDYIVAGKISRKDHVISQFVTHEFGMPLPELKVDQNISDIEIPDVKAIDEAFREALTNVWPELDKIRIERLKAAKEILEKEIEPIQKDLDKINEELNV